MIDNKLIFNLLDQGKNTSKEDILKTLEKAEKLERINLEEVASLIQLEDKELIEEMFKVAGKIKNEIYGKRVVMFAPLYVSDYCVNRCKYCGYNACNEFDRKKLTMDQIKEEVKALEKMGHKRLALEAGEDDKNCSIDYILECIDTIYNTDLENGENIRRINVNIASTTVENYKKLKEAEIGTYILFQETYHKPTYEQVHISGPKKSYEYHLTAFDRAIQAGIGDVGGGVLLGLYDYKFELLGLMLHNKHLEDTYNIGFHTVSVPRIREAVGMTLKDFPHIITDEEFKKIVAIIRISLPFTGIIVSTREDSEMREEVINYGVSQLSAASSTEVGGYKTFKKDDQFILKDTRTMEQVIEDLIDAGYIPSFCTGCYRMGRTGEDFLKLVNDNKIKEFCTPNAMLTLYEYSLDHLDNSKQRDVLNIINKELEDYEDNRKNEILKRLEKIENGERDLYF